MGISRKTVSDLYTEFALAEKVYQYTIKDINPEISDDEARTITVEHILIKTYALDGTGRKVEYAEEAKKDAYAKAGIILLSKGLSTPLIHDLDLIGIGLVSVKRIQTLDHMIAELRLHHVADLVFAQIKSRRLKSRRKILALINSEC